VPAAIGGGGRHGRDDVGQLQTLDVGQELFEQAKPSGGREKLGMLIELGIEITAAEPGVDAQDGAVQPARPAEPCHVDGGSSLPAAEFDDRVRL
jgi:hypothetical protein